MENLFPSTSFNKTHTLTCINEQNNDKIVHQSKHNIEQPKQSEQENNLSEKEKQKKQSESVIKIIQEEWKCEIRRLKEGGIYLTNYRRVPKHILDTKDSSFNVTKANASCIESGHAEIESNRILLIFGNALEVLYREEFHETVEEIYIEYALS